MRASAASLDEHLHADVMRFLAIIAFCLIAIFALVRNTQAPRPEPDLPAAAAAPTAAAARPVPPTIPPTLPEPAPASTPLPPPVRPSPAPVVEPSPAPSASQTPRPDVLERPTHSEPVAEPTRPAPKLAVEPATAPSEAPPLALKFTSDAAFLRLLSSGRARLYAGEADGWMTLHRGTTWQTTRAPRSYHELLLATLPQVVTGAFPGDPAQVQWGVTLPASTEHAITQLAARHDTGRLLIDRHANVRFSP